MVVSIRYRKVLTFPGWAPDKILQYSGNSVVLSQETYQPQQTKADISFTKHEEGVVVSAPAIHPAREVRLADRSWDSFRFGGKPSSCSSQHWLILGSQRIVGLVNDTYLECRLTLPPYRLKKGILQTSYIYLHNDTYLECRLTMPPYRQKKGILQTSDIYLHNNTYLEYRLTMAPYRL
ncbi:hypothetical protein RRG08_013349 [Elysia crispata]|uniref:Uncharacterized protein n=1 Tax=Elysia crispata TaxID=231223 RepID=A0AAE1AXS1_9GAST|nr:hypothetical protein RRG08_013349 [Elysia crispata]